MDTLAFPNLFGKSGFSSGFALCIRVIGTSCCVFKLSRSWVGSNNKFTYRASGHIPLFWLMFTRLEFHLFRRPFIFYYFGCSSTDARQSQKPMRKAICCGFVCRFSTAKSTRWTLTKPQEGGEANADTRSWSRGGEVRKVARGLARVGPTVSGVFFSFL